MATRVVTEVEVMMVGGELSTFRVRMSRRKLAEAFADFPADDGAKLIGIMDEDGDYWYFAADRIEHVLMMKVET